MKRFSLILSVFLLGILLVSCGKSVRMTSSKTSDISEIESSIVAEKSEKPAEFVLLEPQEAIEGVDSKGRTYGNETYWKGVFIPGRTVILSPYYMGKYEVTYKLWKKVYDWAVDNGYTFKNPSIEGSHGDRHNTEDDPVTNIAWLDCIVWCNAYTEMTQKNTDQCVYRTTDSSAEVLKSANSPSEVYFDQKKKGYRLPTEAEWEFAARYQGNDRDNALQYGENTYLTHLDSLSGAKANYSHDEENTRVAWYGDTIVNTQPVGQKKTNNVGIYDMSGNVWEWCYDGWESSLPTGKQNDPIIAASVNDRVIRGGSWGNQENSCVVGCRYYRDANNSPYWKFLSNDKLGFRLAYNQ